MMAGFRPIGSALPPTVLERGGRAVVIPDVSVIDAETLALVLETAGVSPSFFFTLLTGSPPRPRRRHRERGAGRSLDTGIRPRPRVLIVDDDEDTRELYAWCMRAAGWAVELAANGAQGLLVAVVPEPDVIVMDLHMPVLGGLDAIRRLKCDEATKHVPVVACTALDPRSSEVEARNAGCDEFVAKPCEPEALRDLLETMVARWG
jgi:CheY-like chemotaxis protein